jgi:hypothetical protein
LVGLSISWLAVSGSLHAASAIQAVSARNPTVALPAGGSSDSAGAFVSADGRYVVFSSTAANLVPGQTDNLALNVFLRDRQTGLTRLVSTNAFGPGGGSANSVATGLSADGRFILFESRATNLVALPTSGSGDIFVYDASQGTHLLVSVNDSGTVGGNGASFHSSFTPDGRFVVFESAASDLVPGDTNGVSDVFVRDLPSNRTVLVPATAIAPQTPPIGGSAPVISRDGRFVAFEVNQALTNQWVSQVWEWNLQLQTNLIVSADTNGLPASIAAYSTTPAVSADGRYITFLSPAHGLVTNTPVTGTQLYWRDMLAGQNVRVRSDTLAAFFTETAMTDDGRFVAYVLAASTDTVYVWDSQNRTNTLASVGADGQPAVGFCGSLSFSDDGQTLAFISNATNLVASATNNVYQVYIRDLPTGITELASVSAVDQSPANADCAFAALSANGRVVVFQAGDGNLVPNDNNRATDVFARDFALPSVELVSTRDATTAIVTSDASSALAVNGLSAAGRFVLFTSQADDLVTNDTNQSPDVFLRDLTDGTTVLVSVNSSGAAAAGTSFNAAMSPDGRFVTFLSTAADLSPLATNLAWNAFLRDVQTGTTTLISADLTGTTAVGAESGITPAVSADGHWVGFASRATNLVAGQSTTTKTPEVYLRDLQAQVTLPVSAKVTPTLPATIRGNYQAMTFAPGVFFWLATSNLFSFDLVTLTNRLIGTSTFRPAITPDGLTVGRQISLRSVNQVLVDHLDTGVTQVVLSNIVAVSGTGLNAALSLSADGRYLVFLDNSGQLSPGDNNVTNDIIVTDLSSQPEWFTTASLNPDGVTGNGPSDSPVLSADGRFVAFRSWATDLVPNPVSPGPNLFLRDLAQGITWLVNEDPTTMASAAGLVMTPLISANGRVVAFTSFASDLVPGDFNRLGDVLAFTVPAGVLPGLYIGLRPASPGHGPVVTWNATPGWTPVVQAKDSLNDPVWRNLPGTPQDDGQGGLLLEDTTGGGDQARFYRVLVQP